MERSGNGTCAGSGPLEGAADHSRPGGPSVAIVHDYLTQRGGAERVVLAMHRCFPDSKVHTSLFDPDGTFPEAEDLPVVTSPLNRIGTLRRSHRLALPLLAPGFSAMKVEADVVLCSSSGWSHGVRTESPKLVYCYAPARWLYQRDRYLREVGRAARVAISVLGPPLRTWDRRAAGRADRYVTSSRYMQRHIAEVYGIQAEVLAPPHGMDARAGSEPVEGLEPGYVLVVSRLLPYKNVDVVMQAVELLEGQSLVVVGRGPEAARLEAMAGERTTFLAGLTDSQLRWVYANASVLVGASHEDFGLTPLEAAAFGVPAAVLRFGGYLDTVVEDRTGAFFDSLDPREVADAIARVQRGGYDPVEVAAHAESFAEPRFASRLRELVAGVASSTAESARRSAGELVGGPRAGGSRRGQVR